MTDQIGTGEISTPKDLSPLERLGFSEKNFTCVMFNSGMDFLVKNPIGGWNLVHKEREELERLSIFSNDFPQNQIVKKLSHETFLKGSKPLSIGLGDISTINNGGRKVNEALLRANSSDVTTTEAGVMEGLACAQKISISSLPTGRENLYVTTVPIANKPGFCQLVVISSVDEAIGADSVFRSLIKNVLCGVTTPDGFLQIDAKDHLKKYVEVAFDVFGEVLSQEYARKFIEDIPTKIGEKKRELKQHPWYHSFSKLTRRLKRETRSLDKIFQRYKESREQAEEVVKEVASTILEEWRVSFETNDLEGIGEIFHLLEIKIKEESDLAKLQGLLRKMVASAKKNHQPTRKDLSAREKAVDNVSVDNRAYIRELYEKLKDYHTRTEYFSKTSFEDALLWGEKTSLHRMMINERYYISSDLRFKKVLSREDPENYYNPERASHLQKILEEKGYRTRYDAEVDERKLYIGKDKVWILVDLTPARRISHGKYDLSVNLVEGENRDGTFSSKKRRMEKDSATFGYVLRKYMELYGGFLETIYLEAGREPPGAIIRKIKDSIYKKE